MHYREEEDVASKVSIQTANVAMATAGVERQAPPSNGKRARERPRDGGLHAMTPGFTICRGQTAGEAIRRRCVVNECDEVSGHDYVVAPPPETLHINIEICFN
ncbi:hypothetical protein NHX12_023406 [Muraenolepis orangiensis]|uniref:Uncharacterized protein n=1 Tax=Muraenolepis orangiensis TaxID=630683 RepID=A0A9Q0IPZ8_9TELE|nr:hypothetical protein NHX12_023406 [Muraenolepis orangiensis]